MAGQVEDEPLVAVAPERTVVGRRLRAQVVGRAVVRQRGGRTAHVGAQRRERTLLRPVGHDAVADLLDGETARVFRRVQRRQERRRIFPERRLPRLVVQLLDFGDVGLRRLARSRDPGAGLVRLLHAVRAEDVLEDVAPPGEHLHPGQRLEVLAIEGEDLRCDLVGLLLLRQPPAPRILDLLERLRAFNALESGEVLVHQADRLDNLGLALVHLLLGP